MSDRIKAAFAGKTIQSKGATRGSQEENALAQSEKFIALYDEFKTNLDGLDSDIKSELMDSANDLISDREIGTYLDSDADTLQDYLLDLNDTELVTVMNFLISNDIIDFPEE